MAAVPPPSPPGFRHDHGAAMQAAPQKEEAVKFNGLVQPFLNRSPQGQEDPSSKLKMQRKCCSFVFQDGKQCSRRVSFVFSTIVCRCGGTFCTQHRDVASHACRVETPAPKVRGPDERLYYKGDLKP